MQHKCILRNPRFYESLQMLERPLERNATRTWLPPKRQTLDKGLPVYVMLPLDSIWLMDRSGHKVFHKLLFNLYQQTQARTVCLSVGHSC